jgi:C4-dicarboxylate-specific signal transduction histidine kinase
VGVAFLSMLLLAAGLVWAGTRTRMERQREVLDEAASIAVTAAAYLDEHLKGLSAVAAVLVRHPSVQAIDSAACNQLFADVLREQPLVTNVILATPDGTVRASALHQEDGRTSPAWVADAIRAAKPVVGEYGIGTLSGKPTITLAYPVGAPDAVVAVLGIVPDLTQLQTVFSGIPLPGNSVVTVADRAGRVLLWSREPAKFVGARAGAIEPSGVPRTALRTGADGVERFYADAALQRAPWVLGVGIPRAVVTSRLSAMWTRNLLIAVGACITSLLFVLWLAHVMSGHLNRLRSAVQRIADGDLSPPVVGSVPNQELGELQGAFITMAANLRDTRDALDRQVEQERKMNEMLQSLQRQVVRQERLAAVGLLVSGVAHELNNPLQAILGTAELLERHANLGSDVLDEVLFVKTQSGRARDIIRNLARFASQQSGPTALVNLGDVITEVVQLRNSNLQGAGIALDVRIESSRQVYANFTELEQVTLNFVINAQQSMEACAQPGGRLAIHLFDIGKNVRLEVRDNGPGVTRDDEPKLFQPFFTTKPVGKGTGLGLSVSYGIIDSYSGRIGHEKNEWGGATFFFELAAVETEPDNAHDGPAILRRPT